jgi:acetyl/propionyl-CoA carboxylase alpha subunit
VRNDAGVREGDEISMFYDPMIAKLVTHAPNALAAIDAQARALDGFLIEGIQDNVPFLGAVMDEDVPLGHVHDGLHQATVSPKASTARRRRKNSARCSPRVRRSRKR